MFQRLLAKQLAGPSGGLVGFLLAALWNRRNEALTLATLDALAIHPHDRIIDVGFGGGDLLRRMLPVVIQGSLTGVDISNAMVSLARRRFASDVEEGTLGLLQARAESLPFPEQVFDKVCSVNAIFYWDDPRQGLCELQRVIAPGGRLVLCLTCMEDLQTRPFAQHGLQLFGEPQLLQLLDDAGFSHPEIKRYSDRYRKFMCIICCG